MKILLNFTLVKGIMKTKIKRDGVYSEEYFGGK